MAALLLTLAGPAVAQDSLPLRVSAHASRSSAFEPGRSRADSWTLGARLQRFVVGLHADLALSDAGVAGGAVGASLRAGPERWLVRPRLRLGVLLLPGGSLDPAWGLGVDVGRVLGARVGVDAYRPRDADLVLRLQVGFYTTF